MSQQRPPDHLTSLQISLDQLATQMYASLFYTSHRSALSRIPGQAYQGIDPISSSSFPGGVANSNSNNDSFVASQPNVPSPITAGHESAAAATAAAASATARAGSPSQASPPQTPGPQAHSISQSQTAAAEGPGGDAGGAAAAAAAAAEDMDRPDSPDTFRASLTELSKDLVRKVLQIEGLIKTLPGTRRTKEEQEARLKELDDEMRLVDVELKRSREEKEGLLERVEERLMGVSRW